MLDVFPSGFLSKIICFATSHSSGVMVDSTFPTMDEVIWVWAVPEFIHQDCVKLTGSGGANKQSIVWTPWLQIGGGMESSKFWIMGEGLKKIQY